MAYWIRGGLLKPLSRFARSQKIPNFLYAAALATFAIPAKGFAQSPLETVWVHHDAIDYVKEDIKDHCKHDGPLPASEDFPETENLLAIRIGVVSMSRSYYDKLKAQWTKLPRCGEESFNPATFAPEIEPPPPIFTPAPYAPELTASLGAATSATSWTNQQDISFFTIDPSNPTRTIPLSTGGSGGAGVFIPWVQLQAMQATYGGGLPGSGTASRYAPEDKPALGFPALLPTKAPPKPADPSRGVTIGFDGNVYVFAAVKSTINGIPGGPGITPTGNDSFNFRDKVLFTAGGVINVPINATWTAALTGGFAVADVTMAYNCGTYCTTGGVPPFTASKDVWLPGSYVGGRITIPLALAPWPGTTIGFDYKHVMLASESVTLGAAATRQVTANVRQDIDMFMARLAIPLAMPH